MKYLILIFFLFFNSYIFASGLRPCELIGLENVANYALPNMKAASYGDISEDDKLVEMKFLKKCISKYALCIMAAPPKLTTWYSVELIEPKIGRGFDPLKSRLIFGMVQYVDKHANKICSVVLHGRFQAMPWYGRLWIINGSRVEEREFYSVHFTTVMTPVSLYNAILDSQSEIMENDRALKDVYHLPAAA